MAWNDPYNRRHYSHIQDLDVARPVMKPKPDGNRIGTKSAGASTWDLYLQDQASDVLIDKYGLEKGYKAWEGSISAGKNGNAMFAVSAAIANEKLVMCEDLGLFQAGGMSDYFERSYFDIWKQWVAQLHGKDPSKMKPLAKKEVPAQSAKPSQTPVKVVPSNSKFMKLLQSVRPSSKDSMRVRDIIAKSNGDRYKALQLATTMSNVTSDINKLIGRGLAAEDNNWHDVAAVFFDKAKNILGEGTKVDAIKKLIEGIENATGAQVRLEETDKNVSSTNPLTENILVEMEIPSELPNMILSYVSKKHGARAIDIARALNYGDRWRVVAAAIKHLAQKKQVNIISHPNLGLFVYPSDVPATLPKATRTTIKPAQVKQPIVPPAAAQSKLPAKPVSSAEKMNIADQIRRALDTYSPGPYDDANPAEIDDSRGKIVISREYRELGQWVSDYANSYDEEDGWDEDDDHKVWANQNVYSEKLRNWVNLHSWGNAVEKAYASDHSEKSWGQLVIVLK